MECHRFKDALTNVLAGGDSGVPEEDLRAHLDTCSACRETAPSLARRWTTVNCVLRPAVEKALPPSVLQNILAAVGGPSGEDLRSKLIAWRESRSRLAAAPDEPERLPPLLHRLSVEGEGLELIVHMKGPNLARLSVVDAETRQSSGRLDGATLKLGSGRTHAIHGSGAEVSLQDLIQETSFLIVKPDGAERRVNET